MFLDAVPWSARTGSPWRDKWCHLINSFFYKIKEVKRIAMRADKTDQASLP